MPFTLPALSFDIGALEPHIDAQTMSIHHSKHHQKYVTTLNGAIDKVRPSPRLSPSLPVVDRLTRGIAGARPR